MTSTLHALQAEVLQRVQLVAGQMQPDAPLPLSSALLRLANLRESLILDLRHSALFGVRNRWDFHGIPRIFADFRRSSTIFADFPRIFQRL